MCKNEKTVPLNPTTDSVPKTTGHFITLQRDLTSYLSPLAQIA
jgi:hypothetical protein